jgi:hypothetical protein
MNPNYTRTFVLSALSVVGVLVASCLVSSCSGNGATTSASPDAGPADGTAAADGTASLDGSRDGNGGGDASVADSAANDSGASRPDAASLDGASDSTAPDTGTTEGGTTDGAGPGVLQCGASVCDGKSSYCCRAGLSSSLETCIALDAGCTGSWSFCDKPGDCPAGENCIVAAVTDQAGLTTQCASSSHWVVCTSNGDCQGGQPCMLQTCRFEGGVESLSTCGGSLPPSWCPP